MVLKVPGVTNKTIGGADSLVYEKFGYFGDLFRRMRFNYKNQWQQIGKK